MDWHQILNTAIGVFIGGAVLLIVYGLLGGKV